MGAKARERFGGAVRESLSFTHSFWFLEESTAFERPLRNAGDGPHFRRTLQPPAKAALPRAALQNAKRLSHLTERWVKISRRAALQNAGARFEALRDPTISPIGVSGLIHAGPCAGTGANPTHQQ